MTEYGSVQRVTDIMDNMDFFMVPVVNVDGYVWTWTDVGVLNCIPRSFLSL